MNSPYTRRFDRRYYSAKRLEEIDISRIDDDAPPIDAGIKNLVRAVNGFELDTMGSCEGHYIRMNCAGERARVTDPRPFVTIWAFSDAQKIGLRCLVRMVGLYNQESPIKWMVGLEGVKVIQPKKIADNPDEQAAQTRSAEELAHFLWDKFLRDYLSPEEPAISTTQ